MISPSNFAIHVTYACPLSCACCCFSSGPTSKKRLPEKLILSTISEIDTSLFRMVAFTGGEPFLLGNRLDVLVKFAHDKGLITRIVTSAYWAKHSSIAKARLNELHQSGLDELSISWDDFHEEQNSTKITFEHVFNAFWAAKDLGLMVAVNIVQGANSRWNANRVRKELGVNTTSKDVIVESPLNLTGRAEIELAGAALRPESFLGPCPYVLSGPTLSAKKKLLACCGVIQHTSELVLDEDFEPENLSSVLATGMTSPLLNWLHIRGPYSILEWMANMYGISIPEKKHIGGNCEACRLLFHTDKYRELIPQSVKEKTSEIGGELAVLNALGFFVKGSEKSLMGVWQNGAAFLDNAIISNKYNNIE